MVYKMTPQKIMINLIEIPVLDAFSPSINIIIISQTSTAVVETNQLEALKSPSTSAAGALSQ